MSGKMIDSITIEHVKQLKKKKTISFRNFFVLMGKKIHENKPFKRISLLFSFSAVLSWY